MMDILIVGCCVLTAITAGVAVFNLSQDEKKKLKEENQRLRQRCEKYRNACEWLLERNSRPLLRG